METPKISKAAYAQKLAEILKGPVDVTVFEEFGRFIAQYAAADAALHFAARFISGLPDKAARIIFAGMRDSDMKKRALGLARLNNTAPEVIAEFDATSLNLIS